MVKVGKSDFSNIFKRLYAQTKSWLNIAGCKISIPASLKDSWMEEVKSIVNYSDLLFLMKRPRKKSAETERFIRSICGFPVNSTMLENAIDGSSYTLACTEYVFCSTYMCNRIQNASKKFWDYEEWIKNYSHSEESDIFKKVIQEILGAPSITWAVTLNVAAEFSVKSGRKIRETVALLLASADGSELEEISQSLGSHTLASSEEDKRSDDLTELFSIEELILEEEKKIVEDDKEAALEYPSDEPTL